MVGVHMIIKTMAAKTSEMEVLRQGHGVCRSQIQRIKFDIYDMVLLPYVWAPNFGAIQDFHAIQQRIYIKRCHWILKWQANSYIGSIGSGFGLCKLLRHNPCESSEVESQPRPIVTHIHPSLWDRSNTSIEPCMYCIYIYMFKIHHCMHASGYASIFFIIRFTNGSDTWRTEKLINVSKDNPVIPQNLPEARVFLWNCARTLNRRRPEDPKGIWYRPGPRSLRIDWWLVFPRLIAVVLMETM